MRPVIAASAGPPIPAVPPAVWCCFGAPPPRPPAAASNGVPSRARVVCPPSAPAIDARRESRDPPAPPAPILTTYVSPSVTLRLARTVRARASAPAAPTRHITSSDHGRRPTAATAAATPELNDDVCDARRHPTRARLCEFLDSVAGVLSESTFGQDCRKNAPEQCAEPHDREFRDSHGVLIFGSRAFSPSTS